MNLIFPPPRRWLALLAAALFSAAQAASPIVIGVSAEYGMKNSLAAQSIEKGVKLALDEGQVFLARFRKDGALAQVPGK